MQTDSAFTERILGLPIENYKGYVEADATQRARHIPSSSFFLMHGLADLTSPYLHGTQLARALTDAGVLFQYHVRYLRYICSVVFVPHCRRVVCLKNTTGVILHGTMFKIFTA